MPPEAETPREQQPQQPQAPRKWAGYDTPEELERGYLASSEEAKRLKAERDQYAALLAQQNQPRNGQQNPDDPFQELENLGVPPKVLEAAFGKYFEKQLGPVVRSVQARPKVIAEHPDYVTYEAKVADWLQQDPQRQSTYQAMFQADPGAAMEWSFLKYGDEERRRAPADDKQGAKRAASQAQIPSARAGDSRREPDDREESQELFKRFMETRSPQDAERFAKSRLKRAIPDSFFQQG